ncbi:hypothetical protein [Klebsiella quasipneumoniae]|uniref:hypothetical protein n=1 Tax=Klebsiella quasipneumoniae TaxID=1463165 RepID=UPI0016037216|nr:hypothetical protein [Klebsiella quasipneumoniae]
MNLITDMASARSFLLNCPPLELRYYCPLMVVKKILVWMDIKSFFDLKAAPGKWLVYGYGGERFVVDDAELSKLGKEVLD